MIADLGTRPCHNLEEIKSNSVWINGFDWMSEYESKFPMMSVDEVKLNNIEIQEMKKETSCDIEINKSAESTFYVFSDSTPIPEEVSQHYKFSRYVIDPNKRRWKDVVRILAVVMMFIRKLQNKKNSSKSVKEQNSREKNPGVKVVLSEEDLKKAEEFFYKKASAEVKKFVKSSRYEKISREVVVIYR